MILYVDKTPDPLATGSSEGYIGYRDLGPRPSCNGCDEIEDCSNCTTGVLYKVPVVTGDLVYFQFNLDDRVNANIENPTAGWFSQDETEYYIKATLQFATLDDLVLDEANTHEIVESASVGYGNGSFQNLILNSSKILEYIASQALEYDCFRLLIQTYEAVVDPDSFQTIVFLGSSVPDHISTFWENGDYIVAGGALYQLVDDEFVFVSNFEDGDIIFNTNTGYYYQYNKFAEKIWTVTTPETELILASECQTAYHEFIRCEETVLIEGQHGTSDCRGKWYGVGEGTPAPLAYRDRWRIKGVLEPVTIKADREENDEGLITSLEIREVYNLRVGLPGIPFSIAQRLSNSLYSPHLYLDSNEFVNPGEIERQVDTGKYWFPSISVERIACEKTSDCDDVVTYFPPIVCEETECPTFLPVTINVNDEFYQSAGSGEVVNIECGEGPSGGDVLVHNSDDSYSESVPCGDELLLDDITYEFYVDGILQFTEVVPAAVDHTFNILP